jgi:thioredoxin reductase (NADPH)
MYDVIVVGGGPAGLAAAIHSAIFGLHTIVLEANQKAGGLATKAHGIDNYPGFRRRISGLRLMENMIHQAKKNGVEFRTSEEVIGLSLIGKDKAVQTEQDQYQCKALILASGDGMNGLGMKWETWIGGGIAYCAECARPFFGGKEIIVVGNVREAVDEALRLAKMAKNVRLVSYANMVDINSKTRKQLEEEHVTLIEDFVGKEIKGNPPSKQLVLQHVSNAITRTLKTNIILVIAGVKPFVSILRNAGLKTHRQGCVIVDELGRTNIEGVFATGGCASTIKDMVPACVGDGTTVATCARLYLAYQR